MQMNRSSEEKYDNETIVFYSLLQSSVGSCKLSRPTIGYLKRQQQFREITAGAKRGPRFTWTVQP